MTHSKFRSLRFEGIGFAMPVIVTGYRGIDKGLLRPMPNGLCRMGGTPGTLAASGSGQPGRRCTRATTRGCFGLGGATQCPGKSLLANQQAFSLARVKSTLSARDLLGKTDAGNVELARHEFGKQHFTGSCELLVLLRELLRLLK